MIGSWYCLPEGELSVGALTAYAEDGFTHFQTLDRTSQGWVAYSREGNLRALDLCAATGLKCFVVDGRIYRGDRPYRLEAAPTDVEVDAVAGDYGGHPALAGYLLYDEPSPHAFPALAGTIARLREPVGASGKAPDHEFALVPMFPMHDDPRFPNAFEGRDYETYLRDFVATCQPSVLAYDYYSFFDPPARMPQYLENFVIAARVAREAGLPLWYYPAIVAGPPAHLPATIGRIRLQANLAIAHGASGLLHFTYRSKSRAPREVVRQANQEATELLRAIGGRWPGSLEVGEDAVVAAFDDARLVVNRDAERERELRGVRLPPGGAALVPLA
jgi:hypothetical protein